jgi:hypothetical protein
LFHEPDVRFAEEHFLSLDHRDVAFFPKLIFDFWQPNDFRNLHGTPRKEGRSATFCSIYGLSAVHL